jgi:hypothetical protein
MKVPLLFKMESPIISAMLIILIIFCFYYSLKDEGYSSENYEKSKGSPIDSVQTLIDRIDWSSSIEGRLRYNSMFFVIANTITFFLFITIYKGNFPDIRTYILALCVTYLLLIASHHFIDHHMKKYSYSNLYSNIQTLRRKLNLSNNVEFLCKNSELTDSKNTEYIPYKYSM